MSGSESARKFSPKPAAFITPSTPTWLKHQSAVRQNEVLGPTRHKLFRAGGLDMDRFYNDKDKFLTLDELRKRDVLAFMKPGLAA